jgi:hypothetical protein
VTPTAQGLAPGDLATLHTEPEQSQDLNPVGSSLALLSGPGCVTQGRATNHPELQPSGNFTRQAQGLNCTSLFFCSSKYRPPAFGGLGFEIRGGFIVIFTDVSIVYMGRLQHVCPFLFFLIHLFIFSSPSPFRANIAKSVRLGLKNKIQKFKW